MIIKCANLINEESGKISIGDCFIGDKPEDAITKLESYSRVFKDNKGEIRCWLDIDLMWPKHVISDKDVFDASIYCTYDPYSDDGLIELRLSMNCSDNYPYHTLAEFQEKLDLIAKSSYFEYTTPVISPKSSVGYISIESSLCEYELMWNKKGHKGNKYIEAIVTPNFNTMVDSPFEMEMMISKIKRKLALELGKYLNELTDSETKEAMKRVGIGDIIAG